MAHPARRKGMSKMTLSRHIKSGRTKAKAAKNRGVPASVAKRARAQGVPASFAYFKGGKWHVPSPKRDSRPKANKRLSGKTPNWAKHNEWRGDHNKTRKQRAKGAFGWF